MIRDYLVITDDPKVKCEIAKRMIEEITILEGGEYKQFYTPLMLSKMEEQIKRYDPSATAQERESLRYQFIYDFWVYGCTVDEEYYLKLKDMTDAEKREYMLGKFRSVYVKHLNWDAGPDRVAQLEDKYRLYRTLEPYYKRDVIEISSPEDYDTFAAFVAKHPTFVVKPSNFFFSFGVHKASMSDYGNDCRAAMESILGEGEAIHAKNPYRDSKMVLEELIVQDPAMAAMHAESVNVVRVTAVRDPAGTVHIYHPWLKAGIGGSFVATAVSDGFDAEIDAETGVIISDGFQENGNVYKVHPDTGITIKGFQIPRWEELTVFVNEIMDQLPGYRYVGWDLVLTPDGWCVLEGNYSGEFIYQLIHGRGFKKEFEALIGWKYEKEFWWEDFDKLSHN